ncbi:MAG: DNA polymerase III subunit delta' [Neisseriaceae bacterium]|nr:DNA polymerase III subunit delta' [Neisseriaceae bacterium]
MIYPWHQESWQKLTSCQDKLPNAWLLIGQRGVGKRTFARHLSTALLCENPSSPFVACGKCQSCHLSSQNSHPDLYELTPIIEDEDNAKKLLQIKIEAVRKMIESVHLTPLRAKRRVVLIHPAESMNVQAANALLKVLEEPSDTVIFILIAHSRDRLLPTIKSRCRQFLLPTPPRSEALAYLRKNKVEHAEEKLAFYGGSPLLVTDEDYGDLHEEFLHILTAPKLLLILNIAEHFDKSKLPLSLFLDWFHKWLIDLIAVSQGCENVFYPQHRTRLAELVEDIQILPLFALYDKVTNLVPYGQHTLNVKLAVESLLIDYLKLTLDI